MENKMLDTYEQMLEFLNMSVTKDGYVRMNLGGGEYLPVVAKDGLSVVLPTMERLQSAEVRNQVVFHLLSEQANQETQTDLMSRYRHWAISRLNIVIGALGTELIRIAADKELVKKLRPDQKEYLALVENADEVAYKNFDKMADAASVPNQLQNVFITLYLKSPGVIDKKPYNRVSVVDFPFFNELTTVVSAIKEKKDAKNKHLAKPDNVVFGVTMRNKDHEIFDGIMRYLLPELELAGKYSVGSNSRIAPALDAMMRSMFPIAQHLNNIMDLFRGVDKELDQSIDEMLYFKLDWIKAFENLDVLWNDIRMTPAQQQPSNEVIQDTSPVSRSPAPNVPSPQTMQPRQPAPWENPAPAYPPQHQPYHNGYPASHHQPQQPAHRASGGGASVNAMMHQRGSRGPGQPQHHGNGYPPHPNTGYTTGYPAPGNYGGHSGARY